MMPAHCGGGGGAVDMTPRGAGGPGGRGAGGRGTGGPGDRGTGGPVDMTDGQKCKMVIKTELTPLSDCKILKGV